MKIQQCLCGVEKYSKLAQIAKNLDTNLATASVIADCIISIANSGYFGTNNLVLRRLKIILREGHLINYH